MPLRSRLLSLWRNLFRKARTEKELTQEIEAYLEMMTDAKVNQGLHPAEARRAALLELGGVEQVKERVREVRMGHVLESIWQDLCYGARMLRKKPGFTLVAVLTLSLGIGANTAMFSVINTVLLRPLPYQDSHRLVFLWSEALKRSVREATSSYANISDWKNQNQSFEDLAVFDPASVTLAAMDDPEQIQSVRASANLFSLLGVEPVLGRTFSPEEEQHNARVVVISYGLWQRRFGGSDNVLGQTLEIDNLKSQVIGVMPERFQFPARNSQIWEPHTLSPNREQWEIQRGSGPWRVVGRLKPNVTLQQAQTEMSGIAGHLEQAFPNINNGLSIHLVPFHIQLTGKDVRLALWTIFGAVVFVLLIACTNVANLMLARGVAREREIAIRMALGAGRQRVVRQLLTESFLLSALAGLLGLVLAATGLKALIGFAPRGIPGLDGITIDPLVIAFTLGVSLLTGLFFGLVPALKVSQSNPGGALKEGRSSVGGLSGRRTRRLLVIAEFGLALPLLLGAGLLVRSFTHIQSVDPGFHPERVLLVQAPPSRSSTPEQWRFYYGQLLERVSTLPGVEAASLIEDILIGGNPNGLITIEGLAENLSEQARIPFKGDSISHSFFETMQVPFLKGRYFNDQDRPDSIPVVIINETMARRFWPGEDVIGKRFKLGPAQSRNPWLTVVGVAGDMRRQSLEQNPIAQIFLPQAQNPSRNMNLLVRTTSDPADFAPAIRNEIRAIDTTVPIYNLYTLESRLDAAVAQRRFQTWLLTLFSAVALLLAAVGIYGLIHQSVNLRTHEIGIRLALGARPVEVLRLVIREGMSLAVWGIGVGLLAALGLTRILAGLLFGVTATDPATFIAAPLFLALAAFLACYIPARRATKIDPLVVLRHE